MKGTKTATAIILGISLVAGFACGGTSESPTPTPTITPTANEVNVNASYNGSDVTLAVGGQLIVTLQSNETTGYTWNLSAISDTNVIKKVRNQYIIPTPSDPPSLGQGGISIWTFEALAAGTATISMKEFRSWEVEPVNTFEITVNVE
jgi:inhibitor of cysteine peptidase